MADLPGIYPNTLWKMFSKICEIPHESGNEKNLSAFIEKFATDKGLACIRDSANNVIVRKPASPGMENKKGVVLQAHLDMVANKTEASTHNFATDAILPVVENGWVHSNQTTLGADNGIGVAMMLALLDDETLSHPAIEALFTTEEETGLTGVMSLESGILSSDILLNLDTENEGIFFIGCAGGVDTTADFTFQTETAPSGYTATRLSIRDLKSGHSGMEIIHQRANAIKILTRILRTAMPENAFRIAKIDIGRTHNVIPAEGHVDLMIDSNQLATIKAETATLVSVIQKEFSEETLTVSWENISAPSTVIDFDTQTRLLQALSACPTGVIRMTQNLPGLVETSLNLATVKQNGNTITVLASKRSSVNSCKQQLATTVGDVFRLAQAKVTLHAGYPGWQPNADSEILALAKTVYADMTGSEPSVQVIHAGLECGFLLEKYPNLDALSIGPNIFDVHTPNERVEIESVARTWDFLLSLLKRIPSKTC